MSFPNMFNNSFLEEDYTDENGIQYKIKLDVSSIFRAKLVSYVKQGLKIEKMSVPITVSDKIKNIPISDNGKYIIYTSVPEYMINSNDDPYDLVRSFKSWITRFMYYNKSNEEYNMIKENRQLAVEIRNKVRKEEQWTKENGDLYACSYYLAWKLYNTLGAEKINTLSNQINELSDKIDNMSDEELDELIKVYEKMLEENPELFEGLSDLFGGL